MVKAHDKEPYGEYTYNPETGEMDLVKRTGGGGVTITNYGPSGMWESSYAKFGTSATIISVVITLVILMCIGCCIRQCLNKNKDEAQKDFSNVQTGIPSTGGAQKQDEQQRLLK